MQARIFTISLKPAWTREKIEDFCRKMKGTAIVFSITHDKDNDENGQIIEKHTHILIEYETPRKITTMANLFEVEENFIEVVKSKKAVLRYLTHLDDSDKFQYDSKEIITNSDVDYDSVVMGNNLSDKEIAEYIKNGHGYDLLGVVSSSKLRTIQAFLNFDRQGTTNAELKRLNEKMDNMSSHIENISNLANEFKEGLILGATKLGSLGTGFLSEIKVGFTKIANEINKAKYISK